MNACPLLVHVPKATIVSPLVNSRSARSSIDALSNDAFNCNAHDRLLLIVTVSGAGTGGCSCHCSLFCFWHHRSSVLIRGG